MLAELTWNVYTYVLRIYVFAFVFAVATFYRRFPHPVFVYTFFYFCFRFHSFQLHPTSSLLLKLSFSCNWCCRHRSSLAFCWLMCQSFFLSSDSHSFCFSSFLLLHVSLTHFFVYFAFALFSVDACSLPSFIRLWHLALPLRFALNHSSCG